MPWPIQARGNSGSAAGSSSSARFCTRRRGESRASRVVSTAMNEMARKRSLQEARHAASIVHGQEAELPVPMRLASSSPWRRRMGRSSKDTWSAGRIPRTAVFAKARGLKGARRGAGAANVEAWCVSIPSGRGSRNTQTGSCWWAFSATSRACSSAAMPHRFPPLTASWRALATPKAETSKLR